MNILVTGGLGFIGSNLTRELLWLGHAVTVVDDLSSGRRELLADVRDHESLTVLELDFADPHVLAQVRAGAYRVVFHVAAVPRVTYSVEHPSNTNDVNVGKTVRLLEACARAKRQPAVVFSSSSSVYGGSDVLPTPETADADPKSPYALQKLVIERYLRLFHVLYGLKSAALRYFNVYGPGQYGDSPYSTAIAAWCHAVKSGSPLRLDGDGEQSRDMTYVSNVVQANVAAADAILTGDRGPWDGRAYNIGCGDTTTNNEILAMFTRRLGELPVVNAPERQGDVRRTQADVTRAVDELGYDPAIRLEEGLEMTWKWWGL